MNERKFMYEDTDIENKIEQIWNKFKTHLLESL
jgi:hypothetical protein